MPEASQQCLSLLVRAGRDVAHELKNHLGVALGSVELLQDEIPDPGQAKDLRRITTALEEMDRLISIVQTVLRGEEDEEREEFELGALLEDLISTVRLLLDPRGRQIELHRSEGEVRLCMLRGPLETLLLTLMTVGTSERIEIFLQPRLSEADPELGHGPHAALLFKGTELPQRQDAWSLQGECLRMRSQGADLRLVGEDLLLVLPLA